MAVRHVALLLAGIGCAGAALAQSPAPNAPAPSAPPPSATPANPPAPAAPADKPAAAAKPPEGPDTWIFSGALQGSRETFSATLLANKSEAQFEMKLGSGVTCNGAKLSGEVGMVRLPEITCSDDRPMRALFVPQAGNVLKVFGHVGTDRFMAEAHLLGTEAPPEAKQTAQPKGPLGLPPLAPNMAPSPPPQPSGPPNGR